MNQDIAKILVTTEQINNAVAQLGRELTAEYRNKNPLVIGILRGAAPFMTVAGPQGAALFERQGEFVVTTTGVESSLIYAASALLRETIAAHGHAVFWLDLLPARSAAQVQAALPH